MRLSDQGLLIILVVGILAGWLAGKVFKGNGFGLVGDAAIGIVGALVGDWLLHCFGIHLVAGFLGPRRQRRHRLDRLAAGVAAGGGERMGWSIGRGRPTRRVTCRHELGPGGVTGIGQRCTGMRPG